MVRAGVSRVWPAAGAADRPRGAVRHDRARAAGVEQVHEAVAVVVEAVVARERVGVLGRVVRVVAAGVVRVDEAVVVVVDPVLARAMGEAGRKRVLDRFTWSASTRHLATLIESVSFRAPQMEGATGEERPI